MKKVTEQEQTEMSENSYIEGMNDSNNMVDAVAQRLRNSLTDMSEITDKSIENEWRTLARFLELYEEMYFSRLDEIKHEREMQRYKEEGII